MHPGALREVQVVRVEDVTPGMRRITLGGSQLGEFSPGDGATLPALVSTGFDDDVRVILPYPGETEPVLPRWEGDRWLAPKDPRPLGRYYTVRRWDPLAGELDLDFVKHGVGVATTWAYRAKPGDVLHFGGPSGSQGLPEGFDWLLVVGDETALPAIGRLLETLPDDARAQVFVEVAEGSHRQSLRELPGVVLTWIVRDGVTPSGGLVQAVRATDWWDGSVYAWAAGEQSVVRDVRRHLVEVRQVPKEHVDFVGYWKHAPAVARTDDAALPDVEQEEESSTEFHDRAELLPALAVRLAVDLRLGLLLTDGVNTPAVLAQRTGTVEWALRKFLRYLETIGLLTSDADVYRLTASGQELSDPWMIDALRSDGPTVRREQAFFGLRESLTTGRASFASVTGHDYAALRRDEAFEREHLDDVAGFADHLVAPLVGTGLLADVEHLVVEGDVGTAVAAQVVETDPRTRVTVLATTAAQAAWVHDDLPRSIPDDTRRARVSVLVPGEALPPADAVLLVNRLAELPDAEAVDLLRHAVQGLAHGGRLLVFEEALDLAQLDDHDAEADLLNLALHGSGYRTDAEVEALVAAAGLVVTAQQRFGWGDALRTLAPANPS